MKKIFWIMLLMIILPIMLLAEEIDREEYMPKKLIYSELPDDYPKEIEEYYKASYKYHKLTLDKKNALNRNEYNPFTDEEILHLCYLQWKAMHRIPEYWFEYKLLNSPVIHIDNKFQMNNAIKYSHRYESEHITQQDMMLPYFSIYLLRTAAKIVGLEKSDKTFLLKVWVKAKIIDKKLIRIKFNSNPIIDSEIDRYAVLTKIKIIESLYPLPSDEYYILANYTGGISPNPKQNTLNTIDEFIIPLSWNVPEFKEQIIFDEKNMNSIYMMGHTRLTDCMRIDKKGYVEYFDYSSTDFGFLGGDTLRNWTENIFEKRVKFRNFKVKAKKIIKKLHNE